jgi:hypothetical protein
MKQLSQTFCAVGVVLLFCAAASAQVEKPLRPIDPKLLTKPAQQPTPPPDSKPSQGPPMTPKPKITRDDQSATAKELAKELLNGISGEVRWNKEYGLPYNSSNDGRPVHPYPCQVFRIRSTVAIINRTNIKLPEGVVGEAGTVSGKDFGTAGPPPEAGGNYVCHFAITDLPLNRKINVQAEIDPSFLPPDYTGFDRSVRLTASWVGGSQPEPPSGQQRKLTGNTSVTLTEKAPHARVIFEMVYAP